eukprot:symbB.v1.2.040428.t1/scaffold7225.1/size12519/1
MDSDEESLDEIQVLSLNARVATYFMAQFRENNEAPWVPKTGLALPPGLALEAPPDAPDAPLSAAVAEADATPTHQQGDVPKPWVPSCFRLVEIIVMGPEY